MWSYLIARGKDSPGVVKELAGWGTRSAQKHTKRLVELKILLEKRPKGNTEHGLLLAEVV